MVATDIVLVEIKTILRITDSKVQTVKNFLLKNPRKEITKAKQLTQTTVTYRN